MTSFVLKTIALVFMFADHLGEFLPDVIPIGFRWLGRLSAPIFIFCVTESLIYTRNRKRYILRLYAGSVIMALGNTILNLIFPNAEVPLLNNIFATLVLISLIVCLLEEDSNRLIKLLIFSALQLAVIFISYMIVTTVQASQNLSNTVTFCYAIGGIFPNILFCDGSFLWIIMGILMYKLKGKKKAFIGMYIAFSLGQILLTIPYGIGKDILLYTNYQWMMIAALPIILCYNGQRGKQIKQFFYIFYPVHIWLLFIVANFR